MNDNRRPIPGESYVYVIAVKRGAEAIGPVKVGMSSNPAARMRELQCACPYDLILFHKLPLPNRAIARQVEDVFHGTQGEHKLRGEWFDLPPSEAVKLLHCHFLFMLDARGMSKEKIDRILRVAGIMQ